MTTPFLFVPLFSWPAAPGGKLHTYAAGGTTAQATYSDAAGSVPNTNPVTLDSNGTATVRLNSSLAYHFVLKDSTDTTTLWDEDNYQSSYLTQSDIGGILYPRTAAEIAASVTPTNYGYAPGDIRRYGALTANSDNSSQIQAAINQATQTGGYPVRIPSGTWSYATGLVIGTTVAGPCQIYGDNMYTAILRKTANVVGLTIADGSISGVAQADLEGFTLSSSGGDSSDGLKINTVGRVRVKHLVVTGHGSHGIEIVQGDVGRFDDVSCVSNGGDGIRLTGSGGVQANANSFTNIDSRGNTGWGMNLMTAMANMGSGIALQSNTAGGIQLGACFGNVLDIYCEGNTGSAISFTTACVGPNFGGNQIFVSFSDQAPTFGAGTAAVNAVFTNKSGSVYQPAFSQVITDLLTFSNNRTDGTTPLGVFSLTHSANNRLDWTITGSGADAGVKLVNSTGGGLVGYFEAQNLLCNAAVKAGISGAGELALGSSTATSATAGANGAVPAQVSGYLIFQLAGTNIKVPYFNV